MLVAGADNPVKQIMSQRSLKEAFVSNLNGTSTEEVAVGSLIAPLCFLARGLTFVVLHQANRSLSLTPTSRLLLDYSLLILPLIVSCTILSDFLHHVVLTSSLLQASLIFTIYWINTVRSRKNSMSTFLLSHVQLGNVPFVTVFRVFVNIKTAISILAVDFAVFPRRFAKTETYGTGVMDYGVGGYIFANALVSPEARSKKSTSGSKTSIILKQIISVWPLIALGMGRFVSVKMTGYHEHVTEYGVHWNFFFTLAVVRIMASALLIFLPSRMLLLFSLLIATVYQITLETTSLKEFLVHNNDREKDFLYANKEGIVSILGNVAIYLAGVQIGKYLMQPRSQVKEWLKVIVQLLIASFVLYAALFACQCFVEPVSRRLANLPFCLWSVAQSVLLLSCFGIADLCLLFAKCTSGCQLMPSTWALSKKDSDTSSHTEQIKSDCLVRAVSKNQLIFFLLANVMTGLTNMVVDTFSCSNSSSFSILALYMFINCIVIHVLDRSGVVLKFW